MLLAWSLHCAESPRQMIEMVVHLHAKAVADGLVKTKPQIQRKPMDVGCGGAYLCCQVHVGWPHILDVYGRQLWKRICKHRSPHQSGSLQARPLCGSDVVCQAGQADPSCNKASREVRSLRLTCARRPSLHRRCASPLLLRLP